MLAPTFALASWLAVVAGPAAAPQDAAAAPRLLESSQASALACLSFDAGKLRREAERLDLVRLLRDAEVRDFVASSGAALDGRVRAARTMLHCYGIPELLAGRVALELHGFVAVEEDGALGPVTPAEALGVARLERPVQAIFPDLSLVVDVAGEEAFATAFARALELFDPAPRTQGLALGATAFSVTELRPEGLPVLRLCHGFAGGRFVCATTPARYVDAARRLAGTGQQEAADSLGATAAFAEFAQLACAGDEVAACFVQGSALLDLLPPGLGLDALEGLGAVLALEGGRLRTTFAVVHAPGRPGAFGLLDGLASCAGALDEVEPGALLCGATRFNGGNGGVLAALAGNARFAARFTGAGFLPRFEGSAELAPGGGAGLLAAIGGWFERGFRVAPQTFALEGAGLLAAMRGWFERGCRATPQSFALEGTEGAFAVTPPFLLEAACFAVAGGRLAAASNRQVLRQVVARGGGTSPGFARTPAYLRALPRSCGNGQDDVRAVFFLDLGETALRALTMAEPFLPALFVRYRVPLDAALMPLPDTVAGYLAPEVLALRVSARGCALDDVASLPLLLPATLAAAASWSTAAGSR